VRGGGTGSDKRSMIDEYRVERDFFGAVSEEYDAGYVLIIN
jgi:hypothetical protein